MVTTSTHTSASGSQDGKGGQTVEKIAEILEILLLQVEDATARVRQVLLETMHIARLARGSSAGLVLPSTKPFTRS